MVRLRRLSRGSARAVSARRLADIWHPYCQPADKSARLTLSFPAEVGSSGRYFAGASPAAGGSWLRNVGCRSKAWRGEESVECDCGGMFRVRGICLR